MVKVNRNSRKNKWKLRIKALLRGRADRPRLSVYRSSKSVYVQVIDDEIGKTVLSLSARDIVAGTKTEKAFEVGRRTAEQLLNLNVKSVVFDRGGRRFHGRIKAVAEGARKGGLRF